MIRTAILFLLSLHIPHSLLAIDSEVNSIQFVIDEDCLFEGYELTLEQEYVSYQWEDSNNPNTNLGTASSVNINYSSTYCVTVVDGLGVSCTDCIEIELLESPYIFLIDMASICSEDTGNGPTILDFTSLILEGDTNGIWIDYDATGVNIFDPTQVDFIGVPFGQYSFEYSVEGDCFDQSAIVVIDVVDCQCPIVSLSPLIDYCNMGQVDLGTMESGLNGNWSSTDLNIQNNILDLEGLNPGEYNLTFSVSDDIGWCPTDFDTSIEVIGCFESEEVLTVDVGIDQLIFSWTDELESLDLEIVVLQGPIGVLDGNTYTMSGMSEGEQGGIEIFINTENYQYDNDLVIYGITANPTAVNDPAYQLDLISVYPNPVTEVIILEIANSSMSINSVEIVTSAGITIDKDVEILNNEVNVSKLGNGYYILLIDVDGKKFQLPFVKI